MGFESVTGLNPWGLGIGLGMSGLSALLGRGMEDPAQARMRMLMNIMSPEAISNAGQNFYSRAISSPFGIAGTQNAFNSGTMYTNALNRNLASTGLARTGVGAMSGAFGSQMANRSVNTFRGNLWNNAMNMGLQSRESLAGMLGGMPMQNPMWMQLLGAGLQSLPYMMYGPRK